MSVDLTDTHPASSRLHVVTGDATGRHPAVKFRKFVVCAGSLDELVRLDTLTPQAARLLEGAVLAGLNVLVAGGRRRTRPRC